LRYELRVGGETHDFMTRWGYQAHGLVRYGGAEGPISVVDTNADGRFSLADLNGGTFLRVDRDGDGLTQSPGEAMLGTALFTFGGDCWELGALAPDGSWLELRRASLPIPQLDAPFPVEQLTGLDGRVIELRNRRRPIALALWASW